MPSLAVLHEGTSGTILEGLTMEYNEMLRRLSIDMDSIRTLFYYPIQPKLLNDFNC